MIGIDVTLRQTKNMILYIILVLFVLVMIFLLLVPIILFIDTTTNQYFIQIKGLVKLSAIYDDEVFVKLNLSIFWFNFQFLPLRHKRDSRSNKKSKQLAKDSRFRAIPFVKIWRVVRSFEVKQFQLDIDTGDCITNSKLYPVFACCNFYLGSQMQVNYQGRSRLLLAIENKPIRLIRSYMNI